MVRYVLSFIFMIALLEANSYKSIRIATYPTTQSAQKGLEIAQNHFADEAKFHQLQAEDIFELKYRPSGKYFVLVVEPIESKANAKEALKIVRKYYKDAYITTIKASQVKKTPQVKKESLNQAQQRTPSVEEHHIDVQKVLQVARNTQTTQPQPQEVAKAKGENSPLTTPKLLTKKSQEKNTTTTPELQTKEKSSPSTQQSSWMVWALLLLVIALGITLLILRKKNRYLLQHYNDNEFEQERLQKEILKKEKLVAYVRHEIKNPISAILGTSQIVLEGELSPIQKQNIQKIEHSSHYILGLINDVEDLAKIETGEIKLEKKEFNLNDIVNYVYNIVAMDAKNEHLSIYVNIAKDVPSHVMGDSLRVSQILMNLLGNAIKYTHAGEVVLEIKNLDSVGNVAYLEFSISDTGIGMSEDQIKKLFTYESSEVSDEMQTRIGLGLSVTKHLIELMKGTINVKSKKGLGTTITFTLPLEMKNPDNLRQYRLPSAHMLNKSVLIIDEHNKNSLPLMQTFSYFKYKTQVIPSFEKITRDALESRYDIVVINSQNITNLAVEKLKKMQNRQGTKIVIYNDIFSQVDSEYIDGLRIDAYIKPPVTLHNILNLITDLYLWPKESGEIKKGSIKSQLTKFAGKEVLVVEDLELNQKVISNLLSQTGIKLTFKKNGKIAVDIIKQGAKFDLILMDLNMPIMNGYDAAMEIRKIPSYSHVPILAISADTSSDAIEKSLASGMQGHISKPIHLNEFYTKIAFALEKGFEDLDAMSKEKSLLSEYNEYDTIEIEKGLSQSNNDEDLYLMVLEDFKRMYKNATVAMQALVKNKNFDRAKELAKHIKEAAHHIGALDVAQSASTLEYEFEKGKKGKSESNIKLFDAKITALLEEISLYISKRK